MPFLQLHCTPSFIDARCSPRFDVIHARCTSQNNMTSFFTKLLLETPQLCKYWVKSNEIQHWGYCLPKIYYVSKKNKVREISICLTKILLQLAFLSYKRLPEHYSWGTTVLAANTSNQFVIFIFKHVSTGNTWRKYLWSMVQIANGIMLELSGCIFPNRQ